MRTYSNRDINDIFKGVYKILDEVLDWELNTNIGNGCHTIFDATADNVATRVVEDVRVRVMGMEGCYNE